MVVTDNGSNFANAAALLNGTAVSRSVHCCFSHLAIVLLVTIASRCVCHTLQLVVKDARDDLVGATLRDLIDATHKMQTAVRKNKLLIALC